MSNHECNCTSVDDICAGYGNQARHLIAVLQDTQRQFRYLPVDALERIAANLTLPMTQVYEVATFYKSFSLTPRGEHEVKVCTGTACHLRGARLMLEELERELGVKEGGTTEDQAFTLETVNCVGACAMAPVVVVDEDYHGGLSAKKASRVVKKYKKKEA